MSDERMRNPWQSIEEMQGEVYAVNVANGWFDQDRSVEADIALLHSEVSEMLEAYRDNGLEDATFGPVKLEQGTGRWIPPKPEGFGSELADVFIRVLDTAQRRGIDLRAEYERKIRYNKTRGYHHGGKRL